MNKTLKTVLRCILWFAVSFGILWLTGIGLLFEGSDPFQALLIFSLILTIIFEVIVQLHTDNLDKIKKLEARIQELEKK